jgi:predicted metal-dependent HD superfamily phosphohydrolase
VYDPKKNDNEEQSAELFETFSQEISPVRMWAMKVTLSQPIELVEKVKAYIMCTKSHKVVPGDKDLDYFMDFDLAGFVSF